MKQLIENIARIVVKIQIRITLKHFLFHDIVHGVWHPERGILFTIKEALFRPGQAAVAYLSGKRVRYYSVFYLMLLLLAFGIFVDSICAKCGEHFQNFANVAEESEERQKTFQFFGQFIKFIIALAVPVVAFNGFILFRKARLNYAEHLIISGILIVGVIIITIFERILFFIDYVESLQFLSTFFTFLIAFLLFAYLINGLREAFKKYYTLMGFILRSIAFVLFIFIELNLLAVIIQLFG